MRYAVTNKYGITLKYEKDHPRHDGYVYVPRSTGKASYEACNRWCKRHDSANTCAIVEYKEATNGRQTKKRGE